MTTSSGPGLLSLAFISPPLWLAGDKRLPRQAHLLAAKSSLHYLELCKKDPDLCYVVFPFHLKYCAANNWTSDQLPGRFCASAGSHCALQPAHSLTSLQRTQDEPSKIFSFKPVVGRSLGHTIASYASPTARNSAFLVSAQQVHSTSSPSPPPQSLFKPWLTLVMSGIY